MDPLTGVSWRAVQAAARMTRDQHGPRPGEVPSGCRCCGPDGCALLRWAELVLAGEWSAYPVAV